MRDIGNVALLAVGTAGVVSGWPADGGAPFIDVIAVWVGASCIVAGLYGAWRNRATRRRVKAAVAAMPPEESLFHALGTGCVECGKAMGFYAGPSGGASQNIYCANPECRQGYNVTPMIDRAEKIGRSPPFQFPEDFRDVKLDGTPKDKPEPAQTVTLTRKAITRTNVARRLNGKPRLSAEGVKAAIVAAPPPSGQGANDWLLYLMMWNAVDSAHISQHDDIGTGVKIDHVTSGGGRYGGAGATATWTDNTDTDAKSAWDTAQAATAAAVLAAGVSAVADKPAFATGEAESPTSSLPSSSPSESSSSRSTDSASPAPSAEPSSPSPSYSSPSSDSYSSSSSSYDSGSSSSSFDSGGGGGGGFD